MQYSRDAAANIVIGPPLVLVPGNVPGRLKFFAWSGVTILLYVSGKELLKCTNDSAGV